MPESGQRVHPTLRSPRRTDTVTQHKNRHLSPGTTCRERYVKHHEVTRAQPRASLSSSLACLVRPRPGRRPPPGPRECSGRVEGLRRASHKRPRGRQSRKRNSAREDGRIQPCGDVW